MALKNENSKDIKKQNEIIEQDIINEFVIYEILTFDRVADLIKHNYPETPTGRIQFIIDDLSNREIIRTINADPLTFKINQAARWRVLTHQKSEKNKVLRQRKSSKINGINRFHVVFTFLFILWFISYYFLFRSEPIQNIQLKSGKSLQVYPFCTNYAEILNVDELEKEDYTENLIGYRVDSNSTFKWNKFIEFLAKNKYSIHRLGKTEDGDYYYRLKVSILYKDVFVGEVYVFENGTCQMDYTSDSFDWDFNTKNSELHIILENGKAGQRSLEKMGFDWLPDSPLINLQETKAYDSRKQRSDGVLYFNNWPSFKIIKDTLGNIICIDPRWNIGWLRAVSNNRFISILDKKGKISSQDFKAVSNEVPFFYSKNLPYYIKPIYSHSDFDPLEVKNYHKTHFGSVLQDKIYFVEPPFVKVIQQVFNTKKHLLTTPHYFIFSTAALLVYWILAFLIRWIIKGFV